jgi:hypothetical protein
MGPDTSLARETLNKAVSLRRYVFSMAVEVFGFGFPPPSRPASVARSWPAIFAAGLCWCEKQQLLPQQIQIYQGAHRKQLGSILLQSAIP